MIVRKQKVNKELQAGQHLIKILWISTVLSVLVTPHLGPLLDGVLLLLILQIIRMIEKYVVVTTYLYFLYMVGGIMTSPHPYFQRCPNPQKP